MIQEQAGQCLPINEIPSVTSTCGATQTLMDVLKVIAEHGDIMYRLQKIYSLDLYKDIHQIWAITRNPMPVRKSDHYDYRQGARSDANEKEIWADLKFAMSSNIAECYRLIPESEVWVVFSSEDITRNLQAFKFEFEKLRKGEYAIGRGAGWNRPT